MIGNNGKKYFYDKGRLACMVNVIGGVAFDGYYIHYDAEGKPAFISASVNCEMNGVRTDPFQFGLSVGIGVISGFVGRDGADAVRNVKKYKSISNISKTLVSKKKIALYTGKLSVIKKGFLGSIKNTVIAGITANMGNGARRRLTGYVI